MSWSFVFMNWQWCKKKQWTVSLRQTVNCVMSDNVKWLVSDWLKGWVMQPLTSINTDVDIFNYIAPVINTKRQVNRKDVEAWCNQKTSQEFLLALHITATRLYLFTRMVWVQRSSTSILVKECERNQKHPQKKKIKNKATLLCDMLRSCLHGVTMHFKRGYVYRWLTRCTSMVWSP